MRLIKAKLVDQLGFKYDNGGAKRAETDDCVVRALAIYTGKDYYDCLQALYDKLDYILADYDEEDLAELRRREDFLNEWYADEYTKHYADAGWDSDVYGQVFDDFGLREVARKLENITLTDAYNKYGNCIAIAHQHAVALINGYIRDIKDRRNNKDRHPKITRNGELLAFSVWK